MSDTALKLLNNATEFEYAASNSLKKSAAKKQKLDPKAKVRNRGTVCIPAEQAKDKKDHFPINSADQARNALARVHQYDKVPDWYKGSLKGLQALVARKVKAKYPSIDVGGKEKKSSLENINSLLVKYAADVFVQERIQEAGGNPQLLSDLNQYLTAIGNELDIDPAMSAWYRNKSNKINSSAFLDDSFIKNVNDIITVSKDPANMWGEHVSKSAVPYIYEDLKNIVQIATEIKNYLMGIDKPTSKYPYINPIFQKMLGVNSDGALGPQTRAALDIYKKSRNPGMSDELAFEYLKKEPEYFRKEELEYDDNENVFKKTQLPFTETPENY